MSDVLTCKSIIKWIIIIISDIEKVLSLLDHVIGYYSVAEDVAETIKAGPNIKGLDEYLACLNKLKGAQSYFEKNNPQSVELENVVCVRI